MLYHPHSPNTCIRVLSERHVYTYTQELVYQLQTQWLQEWENLLSASSSSSSFLVLVLGPKVQGLPWEGLLTAQSVSRMPSLHFMAAHKCMVSTANYLTHFFVGK